MKTHIHDRLPHINQKHVNLFWCQSNSLKWPAAQALQTIQCGGSPKQTTKPELFIRWPKTKRQLLGNLGDILKPSLSHLLGSVLDSTHVGAHGTESGVKVLEVVAYGIRSVWRESVVVTPGAAAIDLLDFKVAAWFEMSGDELASV